MQAARPEIAIWDHGELADVRALLAELGIEFVEHQDKDRDPFPTHLLISSGSSTAETLRRIKQEGQSHHFLHLVVVERASRSLVSVLEREGCDFVAQSPIHPTALRLLVQRALFSGENKRLVPRVAVGETIKLKHGMWSRSATLAELSVRGCGVVTSQQLAPGSQVSLVLPASLSGGGVLKLDGTVVGIQNDLATEGGRNCAAIVFRDQSKAKAVGVNKIMQRSAVGPTGRLDAEPGTPVGQTAADAAPTTRSDEEAAAERRAEPRRYYEQPVLARGSGSVHSLIGRDLSTSGMRVSHDEGLFIGSRLQLAVYGQRGCEPVIVSAEVVRESADSGIGLAFDLLDPTAHQRLQEIVDGLPKLGSADPKASTVMTEVLESH